MAYAPIILKPCWEDDIKYRMSRIGGTSEGSLQAALQIAAELARIRVHPDKLEDIQGAYLSMVRRLKVARVKQKFIPGHRGIFDKAARSLAQQEQELMERSGTTDESGKSLKIGSAVT